MSGVESNSDHFFHDDDGVREYMAMNYNMVKHV